MYESSQSQFAFQVYVNYEFVKKTFSVFEEVNLQSILGHDTSLQSSDLQRSKLRKKFWSIKMALKNIAPGF